jgi:hypothetical protein
MRTGDSYLNVSALSRHFISKNGLPQVVFSNSLRCDARISQPGSRLPNRHLTVDRLRARHPTG